MDKFNLFKNFDSEAATAWDQIRQHRNPLFPDAQLINTDAYDTRAEFKGYNAEGQSCYRFSQTKLRT
jgi:hypothetical protein